MTGTTDLTAREVVGEVHRLLEVDAAPTWVDKVSKFVLSNSPQETHKWLGQVPAMRELIGGRNSKTLRSDGVILINKDYESTVAVPVKDMRRDKTGQIAERIAEMMLRAKTHWGSLLSTLILNGPSTAGYDGQFFFDTDHSEGSSGTQSNDITVDISTLPATVHGTVTAPSVEEFQQAVLQGVAQIAGFKDDQGEPMNENANEFIVMVPVSLYYVALNALATAKASELNSMQGFNISVVPNARLTWTDSFAVFRVDGFTKALIRQGEYESGLVVIDENSEHAKKNREVLFMVDASREVGYGFWQHACYVVMI